MLDFVALAEQFRGSGANPRGRDIVGPWYFDVIHELAAITEHQWSNDIRRGAVKGFLLAGPPGTGKTTLARRLGYELGLRAARAGTGEVALALIDGADIARSRYGESEERIRALFTAAQEGFGDRNRRIVILLDDVESVVMARGSEHVKEWHFAQDGVFFHAIDAMDTSRVVVVLTTNRPDLVDEAIRDRFLEYEVPLPPVDVLLQVGMRAAREQGVADADLESLEENLRDAARDGGFRSMRDVERFVARFYVARILGRPVRND